VALLIWFGFKIEVDLFNSAVFSNIFTHFSYR